LAKKLNCQNTSIVLEEYLLINNVLVAVDGSENSVRALDFALDFAEKYAAKLMILNVSETTAVSAVPQDPSVISADSMVVFSKEIEKIHENILRKAVAHAQETKPNVVLSSKLREGNPASQIIAEAKESACSVIVVGHKGVGKVKEFLGLGGISEKVVHLAPCPVVIVR
jgi:nucleotide-binding universal stress UspA family protein